ncbi:MAG: serine/threonine-protein kinase PknK [Rhodopirellula sp. JB044]|uniref:serine/threonine-protein kinase n=1 Tax=Rhodopirellula sp. JB044 TaxID=3342844 RepID=UPI00370C78DF
MNQWEDYSGDDWMRPSSSRETRVKVDLARATKGIAKRPRLEKAPWKAGDLIAGFELQALIGSGSQGWVYEARQVATDKVVALKLFPDVDPKDAVRSKTGFRRMSKLQHRGLVRLYRIHHEDDVLAFSMERIEGENLVRVLRYWKQLPIAEACEKLVEMLRQVGAALAWTHANQLVHRDIKPTNLMLTSEGNRFVIVDCDLAGEFEAEYDPENIRNYLIWTPMYVAPEVLSRQSYCPASDIFSLGMVALEAMRMFSSAERRRERAGVDGEPSPSENNDSQEVAIPRDEKSRETDEAHIATAMSGLHSAIPEFLVDFVNEMLSHDVGDRPPAMSLKRLGESSELAIPSLSRNNSSARAYRLTESARDAEMMTFRKWCHQVLGGEMLRLHIDGTSGIGKSTFLRMGLERLRSQSWPMVFVATCQRYEPRPLQAFSQIADEIVMRFRRGGIEKIFVDSVSESILRSVLPSFEEILEVDWGEAPIVTSPTRPGGLEAAMKVLNQMRQMAPVFFVIDDVQWADQDTVEVLDYLQANAGLRHGPPQYQGFGLITVSRSEGDLQKQSPDVSITLPPLRQELISEAITNEALKNGLTLSPEQLQALAEQIDGQPYRLEAYLNELSPTGMLYQGLHADVGGRDHVGVNGDLGDALQAGVSHAPAGQVFTPSIEEVWQRRKDQLSEPVAELLDLIVIAGRQVTFEELSALHTNIALLESELDELVDNGLVFRDGSDGQYIRVWNDQLSRQLLEQIPDGHSRHLHRKWAEGLVSEGLSAGRIAEHYEKAGDEQQFVVWAKQAAVQALQVYADIEAGKWYAVVAAHTHGDERIDALRHAAESMQRGGRMFEAANYYRELANSYTGQARLESELEAIHCSIRSGRFAETIDLLDPLLERLELPRHKPVWQHKLSLVWKMLRMTFSKVNFELSESHKVPLRSQLHANQISACQALVRPLSVIDNWLAAELSLVNLKNVARFGARTEQLEVLIGRAVFESYLPGRKRREAQAALSDLGARLNDADSPAAHGDVRAGMAWAAALGGRWTEAIERAQESRQFYSQSEHHRGFEIAHTSCCESIGFFQTGELKSLAEMIDDMQNEGRATKDLFVLTMGTLGYSSVAFLMRDDFASLDANFELVMPSMDKVGDDAFALVTQIEKLLRVTYVNSPEQIEAKLSEVLPVCRGSVFYRIQMIKTLIVELSVVARLSPLAQGGTARLRAFRRDLKILRAQQSESFSLKADLAEGIALSRLPRLFGRNEELTIIKAKRLLHSAMKSAENLNMVPSALAAKDEMARLSGSKDPSELEHHLIEHGVADPVAFARLYRGGLE